MSFYKLAYTENDGTVVDLPPIINRHADIDSLRRKAIDAGYDPTTWGESHDETLQGFFSHATLAPAHVKDPLAEVDWSPFQLALKEESGLFAHDWKIFEDRIRNGVLNGILDGNGRLIATMNVIPKITNRVREALHIDDEDVQVFETGAGWASHSHRGLGLYTIFRKQVLSEGDVNQRLIFSQSNGKGASMVNVRDAWSVVSWNKIPFASALMGWRTGEGSVGNEFLLSSGLKVPLPANGLYKGPSVRFERDDRGELTDKAKAFLESGLIDNTMKLWVNDLDKAKRFEANIRRGLDIGAEGEEKYAYRRWLDTIRRDAVYKPDGNGGQVAPEASGWAEFTGAGALTSDAA